MVSFINTFFPKHLTKAMFREIYFALNEMISKAMVSIVNDASYVSTVYLPTHRFSNRIVICLTLKECFFSFCRYGITPQGFEFIFYFTCLMSVVFFL